MSVALWGSNLILRVGNSSRSSLFSVGLPKTWSQDCTSGGSVSLSRQKEKQLVLTSQHRHRTLAVHLEHDQRTGIWDLGRQELPWGLRFLGFRSPEVSWRELDLVVLFAVNCSHHSPSPTPYQVWLEPSDLELQPVWVTATMPEFSCMAWASDLTPFHASFLNCKVWVITLLRSSGVIDETRKSMCAQ